VTDSAILDVVDVEAVGGDEGQAALQCVEASAQGEALDELVAESSCRRVVVEEYADLMIMIILIMGRPCAASDSMQ
jgi:hypothetical protein